MGTLKLAKLRLQAPDFLKSRGRWYFPRWQTQEWSNMLLLWCEVDVPPLER
jgi:hypothetical protein